MGARSPSPRRAGRGGWGNALLNSIAGFLAGRPIPDLTSMCRAARREVLVEFLHAMLNGFSTPSTTEQLSSLGCEGRRQ
jgi:hypothetical protein